jgi:osmotically-inducible protein OsmY
MRMKRTMLLLGTLLAVGCSRGDGPSDARLESAELADADDTARNAADRDAGRLTAEDQSDDPADRELTQRIRRALMQREGLSVDARNVKIITTDGVVTLRGPVASPEEKTAVTATAQQAAGGGARIHDELEVAID